VLLGDPARDGQAEPGPAAAGDEGLEDALAPVGRHAGAVVDHLDHRVGAAHRRRHDHAGRAGRVLVRVLEQVGEHLQDPPAVHRHRGQIAGHLDGDRQRAGLGVGAEQVDRLAHQVAQVGRREREPVRPRQLEQVLDDGVEPPALAPQQLDLVAHLGGGAELAADGGRRHRQREQRLPHLVGDARDQPAVGGQPRGLVLAAVPGSHARP
jgi:hypothetical protein